MLPRLLAVAPLALLCVACVGAPEEPEETARLGSVRQEMVGGTASTTAQDSVVFVKYAKNATTDSGCSGTLIAPDLVLTAGHCVRALSGKNVECDTFGASFEAARFTVGVGRTAGFDAPVVARGKRVFVPGTAEQCGSDLALLQLDRPVPDAKVSKLRFSAVRKKEAVVAVGFGHDGNDDRVAQRMQRGTTTLGVGPTVVDYTSRTDETFRFDIPEGDLMTGESHCFGDSGGPLLDADGAIVAVISRGPHGTPRNAAHGSTGCIDMPELYAGVRASEAFLRDAAEQAGHPLQAAETTTTKSSILPEEAEESADAPEKSHTTTGLAATSCSAALGVRTETGGATWLALAAVVLATARARRRRATPRSR